MFKCIHSTKKFPNVNIINLKNVDKPEGGGADIVDKVILVILALFDAFLAISKHI